MLSLSVLLQRFAEELRRKTYYTFLIKGWERKVCIVAEDRDRRYSLLFQPDGVKITFWPEDETPDLVIQGKEEDLLLLFAGEELTFLHAKHHIDTKGSVRDQLKLDALIRLAAVGAASVR